MVGAGCRRPHPGGIIFTRQRSRPCRHHRVRARIPGCSHQNWPGRRAQLPDYFPDARLFAAFGNHPVVRRPRSDCAADSTRSAGLGFLCFARRPADIRQRPERRLNQQIGNLATDSYPLGYVPSDVANVRDGLPSDGPEVDRS
jgi:hypothetical protein